MSSLLRESARGATGHVEGGQEEVTNRVPILMYHRVCTDGPEALAPYRVMPAAFEAQLQVLRRHAYYTIGSDDLLEAIQSGRPFQGRPVMLTFDDGYTDFYTDAWPLLRRYGFFAEVFIVTERVGGTADWDKQYGEPAPLMPWQAIRELAANGIRFGSHLATHTRVELLSEDEMLREARESRRTLGAQLGRDIVSISLPFGGGDQSTFSLLERCGYRIEFGTLPGTATTSDAPMGLPRIEIFNTDDVASFACKLGRESGEEAL